MEATIKRILVPTDFSPSSDRALAVASTLASTLGASVHLIHVLEEPFVTRGAYQLRLPDTPARRERLYDEARWKLRGVGARLQESGVHTSVEVRLGDATEQIVAAAADYGTDMIVIGTHGRTGLEHLILGSVAERVIRLAACPVVTVRDNHAVAHPGTGRQVA
jgi:nucleotide-binding universal stress UspA family protein